MALRPVMFRDKEVVAEAKELEKVKVEATVPSTCAARRSRSSNTRRRRATGGAPATAPS